MFDTWFGIIRIESFSARKWYYSSSNFFISVIYIVGLLAKKAVEAGLSVAPYIKTSLSPGSGVVTYYLKESGVIDYLQTLGYVNTFLRIRFRSCNSWGSGGHDQLPELPLL